MQSQRILIADDDRLVRATLATGLRDAGYAVSEASSGDEVISMCDDERPDLAILDIRMPGMTGIEAACQLQEKFDVPFMIFSAYGENAFVKEAIERGALGYLVKPLDISQILPSVETALERAMQIGNLREKEFHLNRALASGRETSTAVGIIMERYHCSSSQAFEAIRKIARSQRRKLTEVTDEIVQATEILNAVKINNNDNKS